MGEQAGPKQCVADAVRAEEIGFDFIAASDHHNPWLAEQGHSPYVWSVLGAVAHATERVELMTYVTCPIMRYHPATVAQKAATVQLLSDGRFTLGLGSGENLNEHVTGAPWPQVDVRHEMFEDALRIIRPMLGGETVTYRGKHLSAEAAKIWDLPSKAPPIGVAVSGEESCRIAGEYGDVMIGVQPDPSLGEMFDAAGGAGKPRVGQVAICYDVDEEAAITRAHEQNRWAMAGFTVNAELPGPPAFDEASKSVRREDVAGQITCGPDVAKHVEPIRKFVEAGYTHVSVVQIGEKHQDAFFDWAAAELLPALRKL